MQLELNVAQMVTIGRTPESIEKSRAFLEAVYHADGEATTSEIRRASGLTKSETKYRFELLEDKGLITIEYATESVSGQNEAAQKVAILTEKAYDEIDTGLLQGDQFRPYRGLANNPDKMAERIIELEEELEETQQYVTENLYQNVRMLRWSVARIELALSDEALESVESIGNREECLKQRAKQY
jgi:DNA-binding Lrp family transcriptional regulator